MDGANSAEIDVDARNALEVAIVAARSGRLQMLDLVHEFLRSIVAVPSAKDPGPDGSGVSPVFFDKDGIQMVAVYSDLERAKRNKDIAPFAMTITGQLLLRHFPSGFGIVVNPGFPICFDIPPSGIEQIRHDLTRDN
jgi:hypothetical protein